MPFSAAPLTSDLVVGQGELFSAAPPEPAQAVGQGVPPLGSTRPGDVPYSESARELLVASGAQSRQGGEELGHEAPALSSAARSCLKGGRRAGGDRWSELAMRRVRFALLRERIFRDRDRRGKLFPFGD